MTVLVNPHRFGISFDPASLFTGGEIGDWWKFDNVHTNQATPSGNITQATGLANAHVMTNTGGPPTLNSLGGGIYAMRTNETSGCRMAYTFSSDIVQPGTLMLAIGDTDLDTHVLCTGSAAGKRWQLNNSSSGDIGAFAGTTLDTTINEGYGTKVFTVEFNGVSSVVRVNGVQTATGNAGSQATDRLTLGALYDGTFPGTMNFYGTMIINRLLTSQERDSAERLLGQYCGLSW